jgi:mono/diheme cytochrome c family protein
VPDVIGTILFVLVFVGIGLTVVLAAMRSGRGPSRPTDGPSRGARRFTTIAVTLAILVIGLGLPALVLAVNANNHAKQGPGGVNLSEAQANGRELFTKNCGTCHTLAGSKTVGRVGPNLDELNGGNLKPAFVLDAIHKGRARGQGQMPAGLLTGQDAQDVASYVAAVAGR